MRKIRPGQANRSVALSSTIEVLYRNSTTMTERSAELLKGTLDLLIMRTLNLRAMHGSAIADRIAQVTNGIFQVKAGSLFPALHRMEQEGWIQGDWVESAEGRRVRSYSLTRSGRRQLAAQKENWTRIVQAMNQVLETA
jgi:PadR family transcriptional regulator PadR